jgi:hypothetical protein
VNAFKAAREAIVAALSASPAVSANVYAFPPELVATPAVVLVVDEPMAELRTIGTRLRFQVNYRLQVCVAPMANLAALEAVEALVVQVLAKLPATCLVGPIGAPNVTQVGQGDLVVVEIPIALQTQEG